jgi:predicted DNA-binding transcriptional regulator AlpA
MSDTQAIIQRLDSLTMAMAAFAKLTGVRLSRADVCERLGIHRNTLPTYIAGKDFPTPGQDGKWLLAEVIEWESRK